MVRILLSILTISFSFSVSQADRGKWDQRLALEKAFTQVGEHYTQLRGGDADQSFFTLRLAEHDNQFFIESAEWSWPSSADAFVWNFQCYWSAEEGPHCYQSHTSGDYALEDSFRQTVPRHSLEAMLSKVNMGLKDWAASLRDLELYVTARGYFVTVSSQFSSGAMLCPFDTNVSCFPVNSRDLPKFPELGR